MPNPWVTIPCGDADPLADFDRWHELEIDPWTATPRWSGEGLDLDWPLVVLGQWWMTGPDISAGASAQFPSPPSG